MTSVSENPWDHILIQITSNFLDPSGVRDVLYSKQGPLSFSSHVCGRHLMVGSLQAACLSGFVNGL